MERYEKHIHIDPDFPVIFHVNECKRSTDECRRNNFFNVHWHEGVEILHCTRGGGEIIIDSEIYPINVGDTIVVNSNCLHSVNCLSEETMRFYCLIPSDTFCENFGFNISETKYVPKIQNAAFKDIFETISNEFAAKQPYYKTKIKSEILNLFVCLSRNYTAKISAVEASDTKKRMVKSAIKYIKENYAEHIQIEDVAENVGFSRYYFCHSFKEMTGTSVVNYINMLRCEKARTYIYSRKYNISEIALMCGFENFSYFTKTYKKYMGLLPSAEIKKQPGDLCKT